MPTSDHHNINTIVSLLRAFDPRSVLDVGCGFGKYGVLLREYLDVWHERLAPDAWKLNLVAIEACEGYRNPIHSYVYNKVHYGEAQQVLPGLGLFDAILMADVIEHLEKSAAREFVAECLRHAPVTIVSTPAAFFPQEASCGNPYEIHRCHFTQDDFPAGIHVHPIRMVGCNIYVASTHRLNPGVLALTDGSGYVYLRSRQKLGVLGLPVSLTLKALCRLFA